MSLNGDLSSDDSKKRAGISALRICGFKSISNEVSLDVRPLTILAGANSSGKSSTLQPLLLLKQTLEASYDPGPLLLHGPNVRFTQVDQLFSSRVGQPCEKDFRFGIKLGSGSELGLVFSKEGKRGVSLEEMSWSTSGRTSRLRPGMESDDLAKLVPKFVREYAEGLRKKGKEQIRWRVSRSGCFLGIGVANSAAGESFPFFSPTGLFSSEILHTIHVPGLRGNPERLYQITNAGPLFPGTFEPYVATIVREWQAKGDDRLKKLGKALLELGLTWKVEARNFDDTQLELRVGRLLHSARGGSRDLVSIADVGFGVSQTLPVLVALLVADKGRLVFVEQPEIHLHPRAQAAMADVIADAAKRGIRVVVETHSAVFLLRIQTLVAEGKLPSDLVKLHWFKRRDDGVTEVSTAELDDRGRFGDWPEDFGDVSLREEARYLDAVEAR